MEIVSCYSQNFVVFLLIHLKIFVLFKKVVFFKCEPIFHIWKILNPTKVFLLFLISVFAGFVHMWLNYKHTWYTTWQWQISTMIPVFSSSEFTPFSHKQNDPELFLLKKYLFIISITSVFHSVISLVLQKKLSTSTVNFYSFSPRSIAKFIGCNSFPRCPIPHCLFHIHFWLMAVVIANCVTMYVKLSLSRILFFLYL